MRLANNMRIHLLDATHADCRGAAHRELTSQSRPTARLARPINPRNSFFFFFFFLRLLLTCISSQTTPAISYLILIDKESRGFFSSDAIKILPSNYCTPRGANFVFAVMTEKQFIHFICFFCCSWTLPPTPRSCKSNIFSR